MTVQIPELPFAYRVHATALSDIGRDRHVRIAGVHRFEVGPGRPGAIWVCRLDWARSLRSRLSCARRCDGAPDWREGSAVGDPALRSDLSPQELMQWKCIKSDTSCLSRGRSISPARRKSAASRSPRSLARSSSLRASLAASCSGASGRRRSSPNSATACCRS